jgi:hypothetical protein
MNTRAEGRLSRLSGRLSIFVWVALLLGATGAKAVPVKTVLQELKTHMRWIVGNGNEGKIQELETRIQKHEAALQRTAGLGLAAGILLTIMHLALDSLRAIHH